MNITVKGRPEVSPPAWYVKELQLIDPELYVFWNHRFQKYLIARKAPPNVFREGYLVEYMVDKCDRRSLNALKQAVWEREHIYSIVDRWLKHLDDEEEEKARKEEQKRREMFNEFLKKAWKFNHSTTVT